MDICMGEMKGEVVEVVLEDVRAYLRQHRF